MTWAWWMTLAVILAVLLLIGCIPVGVDAAYGEGGIRLAVKIWLFRLQLLPQKPKKKKKPAKKAAPKQKKPAPEKPAGEKKPNPGAAGPRRPDARRSAPQAPCGGADAPCLHRRQR